MRTLIFLAFIWVANLRAEGAKKDMQNIKQNSKQPFQHAEKREFKQDARIQQGIKSGELNRKEAAKLQHQQNKIDNFQKKAASDGVVTGKEKAFVQHKQNQANRSIYNQKHDVNKRKDQAWSEYERKMGYPQDPVVEKPKQQQAQKFVNRANMRGAMPPGQPGERYLEWKKNQQNPNFKFDNEQARLRRNEAFQKNQSQQNVRREPAQFLSPEEKKKEIEDALAF